MKRPRSTRRVSHDGRCSYCGFSFGSLMVFRGRRRILGLTVDHLTPVAAGGQNTEKNTVAACSVCNSIKGSLVFKTFGEARLYVLDKLHDGDFALVSEATTKPRPTLLCSWCETPFVSGFSRARFCSDRCRQDHWDQQHPRRNIPKKPPRVAEARTSKVISKTSKPRKGPWQGPMLEDGSRTSNEHHSHVADAIRRHGLDCGDCKQLETGILELISQIWALQDQQENCARARLGYQALTPIDAL